MASEASIISFARAFSIERCFFDELKAPIHRFRIAVSILLVGETSTPLYTLIPPYLRETTSALGAEFSTPHWPNPVLRTPEIYGKTIYDKRIYGKAI